MHKVLHNHQGAVDVAAVCNATLEDLEGVGYSEVDCCQMAVVT
jgi:hypothetical protein